MRKLQKFFSKHKFLIIILILALAFRLPWLYTTIEKDEGSFGYTAWRMLSEDTLYVDIKENKPPLLYVLYAVPIYFFGNSIIPIRIFNNILFMISIIFFFKLARELSTKKKAVFSTLFYTVFMNLPVFEGYLAMSESLLTPFLIVSVYAFKKYISSRKYHFLFLSSILASIVLMIKVQALFIYILLISGLFIYKEKDKVKKVFFFLSSLIFVFILILIFIEKQFLELLQATLLGFSLGYIPKIYIILMILACSVLWLFSLIGIIKTLKSKLHKNKAFSIFLFLLAMATPLISIFILTTFINKGLFFNLLQSVWWTFTKYPGGFFSGYVPFGHTLLIILEGSILWLFSLIGIIKILKSKIHKNRLFIIFWFLSAMAFTIIPPAYGHYYTFLVPPLSILAGIGMVYVVRSRQDKKIFLFLVIILIILTGGFVMKHYPDSRLDLGPLHWDWSNLENYQQQVQLSEYIKNQTLPEDRIVIWGWEPVIYWLSEKPTLFKHIPSSFFCEIFQSETSLKEFENEILIQEPKAIIFLPGYSKKCQNRTKEVFADMIVDYNKTKIDEIEIYMKNRYNYNSQKIFSN